MFRPALEKALAYGDRARGGRPPYDPVSMFKVLVLAAHNTVSDARMEFLIRDRLSWLRFLGFDLGAVTPDENTIRLFREKLTRAGALDALFAAFDRCLRDRGYLPMGGQIVDATLVAAPKQRNTTAEKEAIKAGQSAAEIWPENPAKSRAEGYRRALDGEVCQGPAAARRQARDRHRDPQLRLQKQHRYLSALRLHPVSQGHRRRTL